MKTTLITSNENATKLYDLLQENEFYNFDIESGSIIYGEFHSTFTFENLTDEQIELVENLTESLN